MQGEGGGGGGGPPFLLTGPPGRERRHFGSYSVDSYTKAVMERTRWYRAGPAVITPVCFPPRADEVLQWFNEQTTMLEKDTREGASAMSGGGDKEGGAENCGSGRREGVEEGRAERARTCEASPAGGREASDTNDAVVDSSHDCSNVAPPERTKDGSLLLPDSSLDDLPPSSSHRRPSLERRSSPVASRGPLSFSSPPPLPHLPSRSGSSISLAGSDLTRVREKIEEEREKEDVGADFRGTPVRAKRREGGGVEGGRGGEGGGGGGRGRPLRLLATPTSQTRRDTSQLEGSTPANTYGFKISQSALAGGLANTHTVSSHCCGRYDNTIVPRNFLGVPNFSLSLEI